MLKWCYVFQGCYVMYLNYREQTKRIYQSQFWLVKHIVYQNPLHILTLYTVIKVVITASTLSWCKLTWYEHKSCVHWPKEGIILSWIY